MRKLEFEFYSFTAPMDFATEMELRQDLRKLKTNDTKFSFNRKDICAISTICIKSIRGDIEVQEQSTELKLGYDYGQPMYYYYKGWFYPIKLHVTFNWSNRIINLPITTLTYEQLDGGVMAWVMESYYDSNRGPLWLKIPVTKNGDSFQIPGIILTLPESVDFTFRTEPE